MSDTAAGFRNGRRPRPLLHARLRFRPVGRHFRSCGKGRAADACEPPARPAAPDRRSRRATAIAELRGTACQSINGEPGGLLAKQLHFQ
ncbi:unnamed protein product [Nesidiocoris tenuis]|uniref:Uncharacterized protein n=1 Tax=Nesidiocoris tenuis TaxID=355587 RepID=A0A6H5HCU4_9HEMI|nr:unnamed protein product [Nesidiocoris tenuis]